jgi:outer membrane protein assembly factor BamE (lipoprotein component of BamABCDE complex)
MRSSIFLGLLLILFHANPKIILDGYIGLICSPLLKTDTQYAGGYTDWKFIQVHNGMSEEEVVAILGEPISTWQRDPDTITYCYSTSFGDTHYRIRQINFSDGKVRDKTSEFWVD